MKKGETITVTYRASDGFDKARKYKTLKGAQKFAWAYVGERPDMGSGYAVSDDGVGTIHVDGCSLQDLFPPCVEEMPFHG